MNRFIAIISFWIILGFAVSAAAEGMYLAPKFLMSVQNTGTISRSHALAGSGIDQYSQFTLGGALALGIDLWPQQMIPLRLEVEYALRGNSEQTWSEAGMRLREVKGVWNNSTLFANVFWDFHNDTNFTPYVGAGIGMAFNYTGYDFTTLSGEKFSADDRFTDLAWNVGAGFSYNFNEILALDASYRFVGLGYNELDKWHNGVKYEVGNDPYNNEFMLGFRFSF